MPELCEGIVATRAVCAKSSLDLVLGRPDLGDKIKAALGTHTVRVATIPSQSSGISPGYSPHAQNPSSICALEPEAASADSEQHMWTSMQGDALHIYADRASEASDLLQKRE